MRNRLRRRTDQKPGLSRGSAKASSITDAFGGASFSMQEPDEVALAPDRRPSIAGCSLRHLGDHERLSTGVANRGHEPALRTRVGLPECLLIPGRDFGHDLNLC